MAPFLSINFWLDLYFWLVKLCLGGNIRIIEANVMILHYQMMQMMQLYKGSVFESVLIEIKAP